MHNFLPFSCPFLTQHHPFVLCYTSPSTPLLPSSPLSLLPSSPLSLLPSSPLPSPPSLLQLKLAQTVKDAPVKGYHSAEGYIKQLLAKEGKLTAGAEDSLDWLKERSGKVSPCTVCVYAYCRRDTY